MKKVLFNEIFGVMKELGINLQLGTRTNVKRLPNVKHFGNSEVSEKLLELEADKQGGLDKIRKIFQTESGYIPNMNDMEGNMFLQNLNKLKKLVNPPDNVIQGPGTLSHTMKSKKFKDELASSREIWKEMGADPTTDQGARKYMDYGDEMKKQNLNSDVLEDVKKFMKSKNITTKIIEDEQGVGSLFKSTGDETVQDLTGAMTQIESDALDLKTSLERMKKLAFEMSPAGQAAEDAARKARYKRLYEGKGFTGLGGAEGYFRAVVRPFLIREHEAGKIKLSDSVYKSLKDSSDLSSGGFMEQMYPDPVRVFRHHYGDDAFDLIPSDIQSPARSDILQAFDTDVNSFIPVKVQGPRNTGGYLTVGEYKARLADMNDTIDVIKEGGGRFDAMTQDEKLKEIAEVNIRKETLKKAFKKDYPKEIFGTESFDELWGMKPDEFSEGGRVGYAPGGPVLAKGAAWFLRAMKQNLNDMMGGHPRFDKIPQEEKNIVSEQMNILIKNLEAGGEVPREALEAIYNNPQYYKTRQVTRQSDPEMAEVEELIKEKILPNVSEELVNFETIGRKPNAFGGGVGSMFREI